MNDNYYAVKRNLSYLLTELEETRQGLGVFEHSPYMRLLKSADYQRLDQAIAAAHQALFRLNMFIVRSADDPVSEEQDELDKKVREDTQAKAVLEKEKSDLKAQVSVLEAKIGQPKEVSGEIVA